MMTIYQQKKILQRISQVEADIAAAKKTRAEIIANGYQSATMSSNGGSKSYTRMSVDQLTEAIAALTSELKQLRAMLTQNGQQTLWHNVLIVYS